MTQQAQQQQQQQQPTLAPSTLLPHPSAQEGAASGVVPDERRAPSVAVRVPLNVFGIPFGLAGLATA